MKPLRYSQWKFGVVLGVGALIALVLCVQSVRTYLYTDAVLVPQQAEHEAERQVGALTAAARTAGITNPKALGPLLEHTLDASSDRVLWMRVLDADSNVLAQAGRSEGRAKVPPQWWKRMEAHQSLGAVIDTADGKAFGAMLPFRIPRPAHSSEERPERAGSGVESGGHRPPLYIVELAIPLNAVAGSFEGLRQNLVVGVIASITLLAALAMIALRAPHYLRGQHLESELQLARRVQNDLQPKPHSVSSHVDFAASAIAADHVGGDFYDIFEAEPGKIAIVLGDVSGKGVPAALLVNVLQGAIRSSTASAHELALERMNRMLCERTACERFATLFWAVFDPIERTLRYVNAGHAAPTLIRRGQNGIERLEEGGGPVLGLLPQARYSAGTVKIEDFDTLVLYSDGITEATDQKEEEFGEDRIEAIIADGADATPQQICRLIMNGVTRFANAEIPQDDCTLMVVNFRRSELALRDWKAENIGIAVV
jgi:hypothetical protein